MTITFLYSHTHTPPPAPTLALRAHKHKRELCALSVIWTPQPGICAWHWVHFFSLHNKKATSTLYSFIASGKSRMVRLLVWVICPSQSWWAWDFQARERRLGGLAWGTCGKQCRDLALWNPLRIPTWSCLHSPSLAPAPGQCLIWWVTQAHDRKQSCFFLGCAWQGCASGTWLSAGKHRCSLGQGTWQGCSCSL